MAAGAPHGGYARPQYDAMYQQRDARRAEMAEQMARQREQVQQRMDAAIENLPPAPLGGPQQATPGARAPVRGYGQPGYYGAPPYGHYGPGPYGYGYPWRR